MQKTFEEVKEKYKGIFPVPTASIVTDLGIELMESKKLPDNLSGVIGLNKQGHFVILVNSNQCIGRQNFTIAHELGHFVKHRAFLESGEEIVSGLKSCLPRADISTNANYKEMEKEANEFAADLLMPADKFLEKCYELDSIEKIAAFFGVSVPAASIRANKLGGWFFI